MSASTPLARALTAAVGSGSPRLEAVAVELVREALAASCGNVTRAAALLGVSRETLYECRARSRAVRRAWNLPGDWRTAGRIRRPERSP